MGGATSTHSPAIVVERQKEKDVAPRVLDGSGQMNSQHCARYHAKRVAGVLNLCPCDSGLARDWCDKCDLPGSGKAAKEIGVLAPLRGPTSNDSHKELTGMSREDFAKYVEACMHPAPPDVVADLRNARRLLCDVPVRAMELEHVSPRSRYLRSLRGMIGFEADGTTPNAAARGAYRFCEFQWMYWRQKCAEGTGL